MIRTLIFDFGDVFINLDKSATIREMQKLNIEDLSEELVQINMDYEKGLISSDAFLATYLKSLTSLTKPQIIACWNAILIDFPKYRYNFLKLLSEKGYYKLILLSNTNELHINWVKENIPFYEEFVACFDAFYFSHEINFRKPDSAIYKFVLDKHDLKPEECLFIDDTKLNTEAASALGIHTWNIDPSKEDIIDLFTSNRQLF
jgi:putative hydrolase of the HAD superfamily